MDTPHIDSFFTEVAALRNSQDSLRIENENLKRDLENRPPWHVVDSARNREAAAKAHVEGLKQELAQKQESWDKAADYRDEVLKLREWEPLAERANEELAMECTKLREEKAILEKRINSLHASLSDVHDDWKRDHLTMKRQKDEVVEGLHNLLSMCERAHQKGYFPWEFDTKAASDARHILSKHP